MPKTEPFDKYSEEYDEWFKKNVELYEAELEAIRQLIPPHRSKGMEVGIGSGKFAVPLGIKIGVEPSEKMATKARIQGIEVYSGIAEELPFSDGKFDYVLTPPQVEMQFAQRNRNSDRTGDLAGDGNLFDQTHWPNCP